MTGTITHDNVVRQALGLIEVSFSKVDFSGLPKPSSTVRRGGDPKRMLSELGPNTDLSRRGIIWRSTKQPPLTWSVHELAVSL